MPWCPICKNEYIAGKTHCPDCDVDLVDELTEDPEPKVPVPIRVPSEEDLSDLAARAASAMARKAWAASGRRNPDPQFLPRASSSGRRKR